MYEVFFFFSSRRRHTRCGRDWSSDVCSSDLIVAALGGAVPLLANMVEGGKTPTLPAAELDAIGFSVVIFPGAIVRALGFMAAEFYGSLAAHGSNEAYRNRMLDFAGINALVGTPELIALGQRYETPPAAGGKTGQR